MLQMSNSTHVGRSLAEFGRISGEVRAKAGVNIGPSLAEVGAILAQLGPQSAHILVDFGPKLSNIGPSPADPGRLWPSSESAPRSSAKVGRCFSRRWPQFDTEFGRTSAEVRRRWPEARCKSPKFGPVIRPISGEFVRPVPSCLPRILPHNRRRSGTIGDQRGVSRAR